MDILFGEIESVLSYGPWPMGAASCMSIYCMDSDQRQTAHLGVFFDLISLTRLPAAYCYDCYSSWLRSPGPGLQLHIQSWTNEEANAMNCTSKHQTTTHSQCLNAHDMIPSHDPIRATPDMHVYIIHVRYTTHHARTTSVHDELDHGDRWIMIAGKDVRSTSQLS
jgi:hypothetical protein